MKKKGQPGKKRVQTMTAAPRPSYEDLVRIVEVLRSTERFSEFRLKVGDIEIEVKRAGSGTPASAAVAVAPVAAAGPVAPVVPVAAAPGVELASLPEGVELVRSPTMGTFYRAPKPGAPPFVEPGVRVDAGVTIGLVEVMKLFNSVHAPHAGTVTHVLVADGAVVAEGQPLIAIRPA